MRYALAFFTFCLFTSTLKAQSASVTVKPLLNYDFIGDASDLKPGVNCFVITERRHFDKFFGKSNRPDTPQFAKENVLVLLMPETNRDSKLSFKRADTKAGDFIEVYCETDLNKGKLTYKIFPIALGVIPKYAGVKKVNFYDGNMRKIKTVDVK